MYYGNNTALNIGEAGVRSGNMEPGGERRPFAGLGEAEHSGRPGPRASIVRARLSAHFFYLDNRQQYC
jgi:hypothetical protein